MDPRTADPAVTATERLLLRLLALRHVVAVDDPTLIDVAVAEVTDARVAIETLTAERQAPLDDPVAAERLARLHRRIGETVHDINAAAQRGARRIDLLLGALASAGSTAAGPPDSRYGPGGGRTTVAERGTLVVGAL